MWGNCELPYSEWCKQEQEARAPFVHSRHDGAEVRLLNEREIAKWWNDGHVEYLRLQEAGGSPTLSHVLADGLIDVLLGANASAMGAEGGSK